MIDSFVDVWTTLGLDATRDSKAIKHAYAKALKTNRPDDDPLAYQRLREAYDMALAFARAAIDESPDSGTDEATAPLARRTDGHGCEEATIPGAATGFKDESDAIACAGSALAEVTEPDRDEPSRLSPEFLAKSLHSFWLGSGDERVVELWPRVQWDLDNLPLHLRDEASSWFATLVLEAPTFPRAVVLSLAHYFSWGRDFRVDNALGSEQAHAIRERLRKLGALMITDPKVVRRFTVLTRIGQCLEAGRMWRARWLCWLGGIKQFERLRDAPPELTSRLGLSETSRAMAFVDLKTGAALHGAMLCLAIGVFATSVGHATGFAVFLACMLCLIGLFVFSAIVLVSALFDRVAVEFPRFWRKLQGVPRSRRFAFGVLLTCVAAAGGIALAGSSAPLTFLPLVFVAHLLAALVVWEPTSGTRMLLAPVVFAWAWMLHRLLPPELPVSIAIAGAMLWVFWLQHLLLVNPHRVLAAYRAPLGAARESSDWRSLAGRVSRSAMLPIAAVLAAPLTYFIQARRHGTLFALAALALAFVLAGLTEQHPWLTPLWFAGIPVAVWIVQAALDRTCRIAWFDPAYDERTKDTNGERS